MYTFKTHLQIVHACVYNHPMADMGKGLAASKFRGTFTVTPPSDQCIYLLSLLRVKIALYFKYKV